jgi:ferredoxin
MKKITFVFAIAACFFIAFAAPAARASVPPSLQLSATGTSDQVQVTVTADPNQSVLLSYTKAGAGPTISVLGTTNGNGSYTQTISSAAYGLTSGTAVTALIGGTNGLKSQTLSWPTVASANALTLSQNAVVLTVGASSSLTASNTGGAALYVSNNSNPSIANVNISGTQITLTGNISGSTNVTVCPVGAADNCPTIAVSVLSSGAALLSFSQTSVTIVQGQNLPITISGGNGAYAVRSNSSASTVQASVNGAVLTLSTGATSGTASITVCSTDGVTCGVVVATVGDPSTVAVTFSNTAPTVLTNQNTTVAIYGPSGTQLYVSNNSAPNVVQANLSGSTLTLAGITAGTSNVTVCATTNTCATLAVTVQNGATGGPITLSQNALSVQVGQNMTVTITGGTKPYAVYGGVATVAQASINDGTLTVYGVSAGSSPLQVCSAAGGCVSLAITVNGIGSGAASAALFSPAALSLSVGQQGSVQLSGGASYYLSGNTNGSVAGVTVSGSTLFVNASAAGSTAVTICASGGACGTLPVTVTAPSAVQPQTPVPTTPSYVFTEYLSPGKEDAEVMVLQKTLAALGFLTATPTGYFGNQTLLAVQAFQKAHGIDQLGVVGPATRAALNAQPVTTVPSTTDTSSIDTMNLTQLRAFVQSLEAQLSEALARVTALGGA